MEVVIRHDKNFLKLLNQAFFISFVIYLFSFLQGCIPVKWTAPEILFGNIADLSPQSDVYEDLHI